MALPEGACSYWQRQQFREATDEGFGASPFSLMTPEECERFETARDEEDDKDPPCGSCPSCKEPRCDDVALPIAVADSILTEACEELEARDAGLCVLNERTRRFLHRIKADLETAGAQRRGAPIVPA